ncbi:hypothetical protein GCM10009811_32100 [Nostocoides veronense]|uniref:F420-dependent oxidoreductase n=2 Tax=Nostocoides veronense TaxID=330836 RepID=A0ABN2M1B3_9MICO
MPADHHSMRRQSATFGETGPAGTRGERVARGARAAYLLNGLLAGLGFLLVLTLSALGQYDDTPVAGNVYGGNAIGIAGAWGRAADTVSYFTEWSNVVVAFALLLLWREPIRDSYWRRVLRADSLMMITVTAVVYAVLLAPTQRVTGWSVFTNPLQHIVVPIVTVAVFLVWGPRGWFSWRVVAGALLIPAAWVVWMLVRGVAVDAYPYDFVDPTTYGYPAVFATIGKILVFGTLIALLYWALDRALVRWRAP